MVIILSMLLLMKKWSPECYNFPQTKIDCTISKLHSQSKNIQQRKERQHKFRWHHESGLQGFTPVSICQTAEVQMGWKRGISCHPFQVVRPKPCQCELVLQTLTYDREKKAWNGETCVAWHVNYHIILDKLMQYGYHGLDPGSKVQYLLNGIRCDKLFKAVATVRAHHDKY